MQGMNDTEEKARPGRGQETGTTPERLAAMVRHIDQRLTEWLARYSIVILRVSLGLVFLGFGALKFAGISPAEGLAIRTVEKLTLGFVSGDVALFVTATAECFIGITLVSGKLLRPGLVVLGVSMVGILSPVVLFFGDLFPGAPTLEGQYVLKDIVLVAAGLVVAAKALGARLVVESRSV
jgi:putative oxidoreductase